MPPKELKIALIQMNSGHLKKRNIHKALQLAKKAIRNKARWILLPEVFHYRGLESHIWQQAERVPGDSIQPFLKLAKEKSVYILVGSIHERIPRIKKVYNASVLIDRNGQIQAKYRKIHLFDYHSPQSTLKESKFCQSGASGVLTHVMGFKVGLSICYDLRFPGLYQNYSKKGAQVLCIPSSFTYATGKAHWEALVRARAIENQCYILAPNQCGMGSGGIRTYGQSMVVDPWGKVIAKMPSRGEGILYADIHTQSQRVLRQSFPHQLSQSLASYRIVNRC